jgi:hypothetical protein
MKKVFTSFLLLCACYALLGTTYATNDFEIIPKAETDVGQTVTEIASGGKVWDIYNQKAS